jgi:hypothetical protein
MGWVGALRLSSSLRDAPCPHRLPMMGPLCLASLVTMATVDMGGGRTTGASPCSACQRPPPPRQAQGPRPSHRPHPVATVPLPPSPTPSWVIPVRLSPVLSGSDRQRCDSFAKDHQRSEVACSPSLSYLSVCHSLSPLCRRGQPTPVSFSHCITAGKQVFLHETLVLLFIQNDKLCE